MSTKNFGKREIFLGDRVRKLRKSLGLTQEELAKILKTSGSYISDIEKNKLIPGGKFLYEILKNFKVNINWILKGEGPIFIEKDKSQGDEVLGEDQEGYFYIPLIEGRVTAGKDGGILYEKVEDYYPFKLSWIKKKFGRSPDRRKALVLVRVYGDSMIPTINPDELVLVDTWPQEKIEIKNGRIYLIRQPDSTITIKRMILSQSKEGKQPKLVLSLIHI